VQEIFEENESKILYGAIIWTPMLVTDNLDAANQRESIFSDPRVKQYWDQDRILGRLLSQTLHLQASMAWDVYLAYPSKHTWDTTLPPTPIFWMHKLDEEPTFLLDPPRWKKYMRTLLERTAFQ
jgi:hypothetical protein